MLEQALDDVPPLFDLKREGSLCQTRSRRRSEQMRAFERALGLGQLLELTLGDGLKQCDRLGEIGRRNRSLP